MNLNELKHRHQAVKAPAIPQDDRGSAHPLNGLIDNLKALEAKEAEQLKTARPLWLIAAAAFLLLFVLSLCLPSDTVSPARQWFGGVLAAVYVLIAVLLGRKLRQLARIDYTESLRSFLDKAEIRHRFMGPGATWLAGSGLLALGVAGGVYFTDAILRRHVDPEHLVLGMVLYGLGYLLVCTAGIAFTYRNWSRDKSALLAEVRKLKREMTADQAVASGEAHLPG